MHTQVFVITILWILFWKLLKLKLNLKLKYDRDVMVEFVGEEKHLYSSFFSLILYIRQI